LELFAAISFAATLAAGLLVGGRLLLLARATHHTAELFLGFGTVVLVLAGILEMTGLELARAQHPWAYRFEVVALFAHSVSSSSMSFAVWRVFYPDRPWALRLCLIETALLFTSWQAVILPSQHTYVTGFTPWFHLHVASRGAAFAWGAIAAAIHYRRLRRQLALGLVEPFLCHRFLLWTLGLGCTAGILAIALLVNVTLGELVFASPPALVVVSVLGLVGAWALLFAFLPPSAYVRFVESAVADRGSEQPAA
jgi:hypothetical protein